MTSSFTHQQLVEECVVAPRDAYQLLPDMRIIDRPGWRQLTTPSFKQGGFNEVTLAVLSDEEADAVIASTIAGYRALGLRFRWTVGPDSAPADLGERLVRAGLTRIDTCAMVQDTAAPVAPLRAGVSVTAVDAGTVDLFTDLMARGWACDPAPLAAVHARILAEPHPRQHLFIAHRDGVPAAVASYVAHPRSAFLLGAVVLPEHRGAGLYRALVDARLADAARRGLTLATTHAMLLTSAPILARMGFSEVLRLHAFLG